MAHEQQNHESSSNMGNINSGVAGEVAVVQEAVPDEGNSSLLVGLGRGAPSSKSTKPRVPENFNNLPTKPRLKALKQYIGSFQYRLNSQTNFNAHKLRPLARIMDTARMIVYAPQPIKCVEAVFVALYLTADLPDVERVPLGFKTELHGQVYQHIVLLVQHGGKWGAFGISRCPDLMNKDLVFDSMSSVIENFKTAYESQGHVVLKVRVGLPVEHSIISSNFVCWRHLNLNLKYTSWSECIDEIDKHSGKGKRLWDLWVLSGKSNDPHKSSSIRKAPLDTKVSPFHDKAKKKKKLASRDATPLQAKFIAISAEEASSSSSSSNSKPKGTSSESTVVAPSPTTVGNSKLRISNNTRNSNFDHSNLTSANNINLNNGSNPKVMKTGPSGLMLEKVLAVSRGFLRTKCSSFEGKDVSNSSGSHPKLVLVASNRLFPRIPVRLSYQTLNAETLLQKSPAAARVR